MSNPDKALPAAEGPGAAESGSSRSHHNHPVLAGLGAEHTGKGLQPHSLLSCTTPALGQQDKL